MTLQDEVRERDADNELMKYELRPTPEGTGLYRNGDFHRYANNAECLIWFDRKAWRRKTWEAEQRIDRFEKALEEIANFSKGKNVEPQTAYLIKVATEVLEQ